MYWKNIKLVLISTRVIKIWKTSTELKLLLAINILLEKKIILEIKILSRKLYYTKYNYLQFFLIMSFVALRRVLK